MSYPFNCHHPHTLTQNRPCYVSLGQQSFSPYRCLSHCWSFSLAHHPCIPPIQPIKRPRLYPTPPPAPTHFCSGPISTGLPAVWEALWPVPWPLVLIPTQLGLILTSLSSDLVLLQTSVWSMPLVLQSLLPWNLVVSWWPGHLPALWDPQYLNQVLPALTRVLPLTLL